MISPFTRIISIVLFISFLPLLLIAEDEYSLRLVPFPKQVQREAGAFNCKRPLILETSPQFFPLVQKLIGEELHRAGFKKIQFRSGNDEKQIVIYAESTKPEMHTFSFREKALEQDYGLIVQSDAIHIASPGKEGLVYGIQTLCQIIRANRQGNAIPCLTIMDWPSIPWRAYQDDLTRGPSTKLEALKRQIDLGSLLKMNIFTYYMEYQYAHPKHPKIAPPDGALTSNELQELVAYAQPLTMNIMGNQQSFGHFEKILKHEEYAALRENASVLTPANESTYQLLDDLYADEIPNLPFQFFNVCCDETSGIGSGPAKAMVDQFGVGGTYVKHILRIHDLIKNKYGKRMMMWGDIILQHPNELNQIPKDVIMMTWGYDARSSFEDQIIPFAKSGFDFFVCPGVSNWSMILPTFQTANINIRNFVRDGFKHGCIGVLNTCWDDDGRTFNAVNIHGTAWGAECSWNASQTSIEDFNRRIGAVLFGEPGEHFGKAIELLTQLGPMNNSLFFQTEMKPFLCGSIDEKRKELKEQKILQVVPPAIKLLEVCRKEATVNADWLDYFLFGAQRLELIAQSELARFEAATAYSQALSAPHAQSQRHIAKAMNRLRPIRDAYVKSREQFIELWKRENKPYALDWAIGGGHKVYTVAGSYNEKIGKYDDLLARLAEAEKTTTSLPAIPELGLEVKSTLP